MRILWRCAACGFNVYVDTEHFPVHCCCGFTQLDPSMGWGDKLATILFRVGVTKAVYLRLKRRLRLKPKCGCAKRQQRLNTFGAELKSLARWCIGR